MKHRALLTTAIAIALASRVEGQACWAAHRSVPVRYARALGTRA